MATVAAGLFGFFAVLGLRESLFAVLGATRFRAISVPLQTSLLIALMTALLLLPGVSRVAIQWRDDNRAALMLPPSWFVGLHETLAGSVIDDLPRGRPALFSRTN